MSSIAAVKLIADRSCMPVTLDHSHHQNRVHVAIA
jgi:hypothetical protein